MPNVVHELDHLEAELAARTSAKDRYRDFFEWIDQCMNAKSPTKSPWRVRGRLRPAATRAKAAPLILRALSLYGVLEQDDWSARLEQAKLEESQVKQVRPQCL